jgi:hypothetical protein
MRINAMKCNEILSKWCKNKHGASKIIDTFETYQWPRAKALQHPERTALPPTPRMTSIG